MLSILRGEKLNCIRIKKEELEKLQKKTKEKYISSL